MSPIKSRRTSLAAHWFRLTKSALRASKKLGRAAKKHAPALKVKAESLISGVVTPAPPPAAKGSGRWEEGRWGLGPMAMRHYRLFLPPGTRARRPVPLVMLLHGCGQDAASFAALTRAAANARAGGFAVLLPEQSPKANPRRCWNWFGPEPVVALETGILAAMVDHVCNLYPLRRDRVFALGLSAGGAMATTLALHHPQLLAAVGTHSGAVPGSAKTALQAGQSMRGQRDTDIPTLRQRLQGRPLPPLIAIHGDADRTVALASGEGAADLWLQLAAADTTACLGRNNGQLGKRHPHAITDWTRDGHPYVRLVQIRGLGHAWSGGTMSQAFSDPRGPDAFKLAWRYFSRCVE